MNETAMTMPSVHGPIIFRKADTKDFKSMTIQMIIHAFATGDPNKMLDIVDTMEILMSTTLGDEHEGYCGEEDEKGLKTFKETCYYDKVYLFQSTVLWTRYGRDAWKEIGYSRDIAKFKWRLLWQTHQNQAVERVVGVIGMNRKDRAEMEKEHGNTEDAN